MKGRDLVMIIDRLYEGVRERGNVCVGLDTSYDYIPKEITDKATTIDEAMFAFNKRIIDATEDIAACFKVQIAYYEAYGIQGLMAYKRTLKYMREKGLIVIGDIKRGDISNTAKMYAKAHFEGDFEVDFITLSPYMGIDSIAPYLKYVENKNKGIFVLVRTSNEGSRDFQYIEDSKGTKLYDRVADRILELSDNYVGGCGFSSIGGVIGGNYTNEAVEIRNRLDKMFFLIPGYGAQGGAAKEVSLYLKKGNGGVVNSSRGIMLAYKKHENGEKKFDFYAREEAIKMKEDIQNAVKL